VGAAVEFLYTLSRAAPFLHRLRLARFSRSVAAVLGALLGDRLTIEVAGLRISGPFRSREILYRFKTGQYEPHTLELFERAIRPGATVVDVGAQLGHFTLLAARRAGDGGCVYAFEPDVRNRRELEANVEANGFANVKVLPHAAWERNEERTFYLRRASDTNSLFPPMRPSDLQRSIRVSCMAVDDVLNGRRVDVAKIDAEGTEPLVLRGMEETLRMNPDLQLFIEFNPRALREAGREPAEFLAELKEGFVEVVAIHEAPRQLAPPDDRVLERSHNLYLRGWRSPRQADSVDSTQSTGH
jgi:FkbM family methyltransferase